MNRLVATVLTPFVIAVLLGSGQLSAADPRRFEFEEPHMGTVFRIVFYDTDKDDAITTATAAFKRVRELEAVMSDYSPSSEVMKLCVANDRDPGKAFAVSDDLARVLGHALGTSKLSDGAFDVTVGPLSKLWREARKAKTMPGEEQRTAALARVGWQNVELDREKKTVRLKLPGMRLDFGGIGKGFAADEVLSMLKKKGRSQALVAAAGDITVGDPPPGKDGWVIDIEPIGKGKPTKAVKLANAAVSTSGDLFQFVEIGGVRYSHLLDPKTGLGLTGFRRATVIAPTGWQADSLTKVVSLLPSAEAVKRIERIEKAAMYLVVKENADAKKVATASSRFSSFVAEK
ncbi:FAD:protein FMN transferase [Limnoglobus roseus]|uniref:FAD:protein FMN transferase n=1 Tax=Limnoglobus roseus TaxID=2598579 RepID=A0A5C1AMP3_9BACT|nr:FAD:protein FMN transferase [Limnoglobus roseus]QEL18474.1 FAD:protein FMN transferase [Limnoglobus roseus]